MKSFIAILFLLLPVSAWARLGETMEECDNRYRPFRCERPPRFPGSSVRRVYVSEIFRIDIEFNAQGKAWVILFQPMGSDYLSWLMREGNTDTIRWERSTGRWKDTVDFETLDLSNPGRTYAKDPLEADASGPDSTGAELFSLKTPNRIKNATEQALERNRVAINAVNDISLMPQFFEAFYPSAVDMSGPSVTMEWPMGTRGTFSEILAGNEGPGEWRENKTLIRIVPAPANPSPEERESLEFEPLKNLNMHRSDRKAFALSCRAGLFLWSREADQSLLRFAKEKEQEAAKHLLQKKGKF